MNIKRFIGVAIILVLVSLSVGVGFIYSGVYPMGADVPHNNVTNWLLETLRERSIEQASAGITVPDLSSPDLLLSGGADYNDMCSSCHLRPNQTTSGMSIGLYPSPPNLASVLDHHDHGGNESSEAKAQRNFWIIKHGIKASGMPAWGPTHDDGRIWAMVAFLEKLPNLTPDQYQILTTRISDNNHH